MELDKIKKHLLLEDDNEILTLNTKGKMLAYEL